MCLECFSLIAHVIFNNRNLSRTTKLIIPIPPVLLYGAETWTLLSTIALALKVFERKVLHKTFCPALVGDDFRIRFNCELYELLNDIVVVQRINIQRLQRAGHIVRRRLFRQGGYLLMTTLYPLEGAHRESPAIDWCDQLA